MTSETQDNQPPSTQTARDWLVAWSRGDQAAFDQLVPLVNAELRRLASHYLAGQRGHTLQTTALVNEAYIRLMKDARAVDWQERGHFVGIAANLMREILVDHARARGAQRRGGHLARVDFDEAINVGTAFNEDWLALDEALTALAAADDRAAKIVELRFFGGLSVDETAVLLQVSPDTVTRDWKFAKVWLLDRLK